MRRTLAGAMLVLALSSPAVGHEVERAEALLAEIAAHRGAAAAGPESDRAEATFRLGETVETLVTALNLDVAAHGTRDLVAELVVRRLRAHALEVAWAPREGRYAYDHAAFADYVRRAPKGRWAPEAKFRLIARRFYATLGADPATLVGTDVGALLAALTEEERFLGEHASHERAETVRFFLAVDHYRIARNLTDPVRAREHERRARQALQHTVERSTPAGGTAITITARMMNRPIHVPFWPLNNSQACAIQVQPLPAATLRPLAMNSPSAPAFGTSATRDLGAA